MSNYSQDERVEAAKSLRETLRGQHQITTSTEYTGLTAYVRLFIVKNNEIRDITFMAGMAMNEKTRHNNGHYGLKFGGGYSNPFSAVYNLGRTLYPKGYRHTAKNCHSNDHFNGDVRTIHPDGGYKFKQVEL